MADLSVRRLLIDLEQPMARHWQNGNAFSSAFLNALSMSFPFGEQFFIDSVRAGVKTLSPEKQEQFRDEVKGFIGQEATHRRIHGLFNKHLYDMGYVNQIEQRGMKRVKRLENMDPKVHVATTAAIEHLTAIMAEWMLSHPEVVATDDARLATMWLWHAAEETEHKCTAFDVYRAMGGSDKMRVTLFRWSTYFFLRDVTSQTMLNLKKDGMLWKWKTWKEAASYIFGPLGVIRLVYKPWRKYLSHNFHPSQQDGHLSTEWLSANRNQFSLVGQ
jgi:predicted metal-dependent hydrolase